jgi:hypothetical protein
MTRIGYAAPDGQGLDLKARSGVSIAGGGGTVDQVTDMMEDERL